MSDNVRIGFVGAGGMARAHLTQLEEVEGGSVVAICDMQEELASEAATPFEASVYSDYKKMLDKEELDAVYVVVPPFAHGEIEHGVIDRGLALFVEKPVALSMSVAEGIRDAILEKGIVSGVGYQLRFLPTIQQARAFLDDKTVAMLVGRYWSTMIPGGWWPIMAKSGGQVVEQATHIVDLMRYLAGEITSVTAQTSRQTQAGGSDVDIPDTYMAQFNFASGTFGVLTTACMSGDWSVGIDMLVGGEGTGDGCHLDWNFDGMSVAPGTVELPAEPTDLPKNIDEAFVAAVKAGRQVPILCSYADAVQTLAVCLAINDSASSGKPVQF